MAKNTVQSVEPNIADLVNGWLKSYKVDYKLEQESLNTEIDQALNDYFSKNGGKGGNRPDAKLLLQANDGKYQRYTTSKTQAEPMCCIKKWALTRSKHWLPPVMPPTKS